MKYLMNHEEFEGLLGRGEYVHNPLPKLAIVYFTANWCGACKNLDIPFIESENPHVYWLKCDVDMNNHTTGYAEIRSIPSFLAIKDKVILSKFQSSDTTKVNEWVKNLSTN
jgi:thioredoxin-like negative regulator of GroEL